MCTSAKMKRVTWSATWRKHGCTSLCSKDISKYYTKHHADATIFRKSLCIFTKALFAIGCCWTQDKRPLEKVCSHFLQLQTFKLDCPVEQKYWWVRQFPLSVLKESEMVCFSRVFSTLAVCSAWFASHYYYTQSHHSHSHHWLDWLVVGWEIC